MDKKRRRLSVAAIQLNAGSDWRKNLKQSFSLAQDAIGRTHPDLIVFPEHFLFRGSPQHYPAFLEFATKHALPALKAFSRSRQVAMVLGSIIEGAGKNKYFNTCYFLARSGELSARYRKIHLFDIGLGSVEMRESKYFSPGCQGLTRSWKGTKLGFSICYDLRFPELFRKLALQGAKIFLLPSNFTYETGKAHWEILVRSRAIENQAFVIAADQVGKSEASGILSYGNSLIVDPWGRILARGSERKTEILTAQLDLESLSHLESQFPVKRHIRLF